MAIRVALNHKTSYRYPKDVWLSPQVVRLRPAPHCRTPIVSYSLTVTPKENFINWQQDPYSNRLARLVFPQKTREFAVEVDLVAEMTVINPFDFFMEKSAEEFPFVYDATLNRELLPYLETAPAGPKLSALIAKSRKTNIKTIDFLVQLNQSLSHEVKYLIRLEPGLQTPEQTLTLGSGSCRDSAWLLVQLMRHLGLAARFASGYLIQLVPDVKSLDGPIGATRDFTDLHAWAEVYLPGAGWIGLDPTSGLLAGEGHIPLACTADPVTAAPITGAFSISDASVVSLDPQDELSANGQAVFGFEMSVTRIHEDPRVTKPYSEEQWVEIEALGHQIDADMKRSDVRLTTGGEPTFVSVDDMDGPEWNSLALGPMKYKRADELLRRLRDRFAPGGFLHHGQGKWYPGESLPRWAFGLYWRRDGEPVWTDPKLVADETKPVRFAEDAPHGFITRLAERLGVEPRFVVPGYEDVWYYLWKERRLPVNVDPFDNKLENPEDRARLAKVFEQGLDKVVGFALPLRRDHFTDGTGAWVSGDWFYRPERMYLVPGDSPMGYRLPLDSLPWVVKTDYPFVHEMDPFEHREGLPPRSGLSEQRFIPGGQSPRNPQGFVEQWPGRAGTAATSTAKLGARKPLAPGESREPEEPREGLMPEHGESAPWIVRTALCVEVRNGTMRVFMPPQRYLEDYLELVATIEETARDLKIPVLVEGYTPPYDPRLRTLKVTPDPGVIEVNTDPVDSWDELVNNTNAIYEEARLSRLGAEKFMIDGRHTGTGGGNHIVVGGATPGDSPFLRRPDLLKSLLGYSPRAFLFVQRIIRRPHEPGPARRRSAKRPDRRTGTRLCPSAGA
jgi:transglutaminase-like putative cysteine protease